MSNENPEVVFGKEEAHEDANTMQAMLVEMGKKEPKTEDYDIAFKELEELKALAEKDPLLFIKLLKYAELSIVGVSLAMFTLIKPLAKDLVNVFGTDEAIKDWDSSSKESSVETFLKLKDVIFEEAKDRLERLEREGRSLSEGAQ